MSPRLLYMEDDAAQARLVQKCLERTGYTVDVAGDGRAGLAQCAAHDYEALIVDQTMPGLSGLEVILRHRAPPGHCRRQSWLPGRATNRSPSRP